MIRVEFPDGEVRDVPSRRVELKGGFGGVQGFYEKPIDNHEWRFFGAMGGRWLAVARGREPMHNVPSAIEGVPESDGNRSKIR